jgi:hypothetical protein
MIKEDHLLACTTKMFEILVALPHRLGQTRFSRVTTWIARTAQVHLSFRTHILAAIRLFTCQRARLIRTPISHPNFGQSSATDFTANVAGNFRYRRRGSRLGRRILASRSAVSTAVGELFSVASISRSRPAEATQNPEPIHRFRTVRITIDFWVLRSAALECHRSALRFKHHNR